MKCDNVMCGIERIRKEYFRLNFEADNGLLNATGNIRRITMKWCLIQLGELKKEAKQ